MSLLSGDQRVCAEQVVPFSPPPRPAQPSVWQRVARQLAHYRRRNKDLSTRVSQLEASRDRWKQKAISRGEALRRTRSEVYRQRGRAELWRHRALQRPFACRIDESGGMADD